VRSRPGLFTVIIYTELFYKDPIDIDLRLYRVKSRETLMEARSVTDVQIDSSDMAVAAKDSSKCLVAGFCRSFPQES